MASYCHLLLVCFVLAVRPTAISAADPDPLQDFCVADTSSSAVFMNGLPCLNPNIVTAKHFMTSDLGTPSHTSPVLTTTPQNLPGMNTLGISMNRGYVAVRGIVPPHLHPRASEMVFIEQGKLNAGFVDTSNKLFSADLEAGDVFVFPRGLVHFLINIGNTPALMVAAYNSQSPGFVLVHQTTFASNPSIPIEVLSKAFNVTPQVVDKIKRGLRGN